MKREFSAGIIIFFEHNKKREYLLLHYQSGHWDFPKGHIEKDETKEHAALRELKEETGLETEIFPSFEGSFSYFHHLPDPYSRTKELAFKTVYFFVGKIDDKAVTLSHEHIGYKWLLFEQAVEQLTYDNAKEILQKAEDFLIQAHK